MEKVNDIFPSAKSKGDDEYHLLNALEKRLGTPDDYDKDEASQLVLQLGSNDPSRLQSCIQHTVQHYNFKEININCGCPSIESGGADSYGASLMKDASLTGRLVESMKRGLHGITSTGSDATAIPVPTISVKCRIGVFEHADDMHPLQEIDYEYLKKYVGTVRDAGANHVILHARPAILSGLSPVKNRIVPELNYEFVERIAADFPEMDVTLNGGIKNLSQLEALQQEQRFGMDAGHDASRRISSHMAGRWCLRRPLDLVGVEALLNNEQVDSKLTRGAIEQYIDYAVQIASLPSNKQRFTMAELCLPLFLIVEQLGDDYKYEFDDDDEETNLPDERPFLSYDEIESLYEIVQDGVGHLESFSTKKKGSNSSDINFKRLSSSFKGLVGTKVTNKWKRNRSEL